MNSKYKRTLEKAELRTLNAHPSYGTLHLHTMTFLPQCTAQVNLTSDRDSSSDGSTATSDIVKPNQREDLIQSLYSSDESSLV